MLRFESESKVHWLTFKRLLSVFAVSKPNKVGHTLLGLVPLLSESEWHDILPHQLHRLLGQFS